MPKSLQQHLDSIFSEVGSQRAQQAVPEETLARQEAFREQAKKIEALRQQRMDNTGAEQLPALLYEVVRHRGHWRVLHLKKYSAGYADQAAAIEAAIKVGRKKQEEGRTVEVRLIRTDGRIVVHPLDADDDPRP